jgi:uncharacterized membrane protein YeaQ/YmgE (transglycosylase-associated protein family)
VYWVWLIVVGGAVGALGRLLHPGRELIGFVVTILVGVVSLLIAGAIVSGFWAFVVGVPVAAVLVTLLARELRNPAV